MSTRVKAYALAAIAAALVAISACSDGPAPPVTAAPLAGEASTPASTPASIPTSTTTTLPPVTEAECIAFRDRVDQATDAGVSSTLAYLEMAALHAPEPLASQAAAAAATYAQLEATYPPGSARTAADQAARDEAFAATAEATNTAAGESSRWVNIHCDPTS